MENEKINQAIGKIVKSEKSQISLPLNAKIRDFLKRHAANIFRIAHLLFPNMLLDPDRHLVDSEACPT